MSVSAQSPSDRSVVWGRFRRYAAAATHQIRARSGGKGRCYSAKLHAMHLNFGLLRLFMTLRNIVEPQLRGSCPHYEIRRLLSGTLPASDRFFSFLSLRRPRGALHRINRIACSCAASGPLARMGEECVFAPNEGSVYIFNLKQCIYFYPWFD